MGRAHGDVHALGRPLKAAEEEAVVEVEFFNQYKRGGEGCEQGGEGRRACSCMTSSSCSAIW